MAAACFSASVIASRRLQSCFDDGIRLAVLFMVSTSLVWFCLTGRDNSDFVSSRRVRDDQQAAPHHPKKHDALLAVVFAVVDEIDGEWITEGFSGLLEAHAMLCEIGCRLGIVPFEAVRIHSITDYP